MNRFDFIGSSKNELGTALTELSLVLPLLVATFFGVISYGQALSVGEDTLVLTRETANITNRECLRLIEGENLGEEDEYPSYFSLTAEGKEKRRSVIDRCLGDRVAEIQRHTARVYPATKIILTAYIRDGALTSKLSDAQTLCPLLLNDKSTFYCDPYKSKFDARRVDRDMSGILETVQIVFIAEMFIEYDSLLEEAAAWTGYQHQPMYAVSVV